MVFWWLLCSYGLLLFRVNGSTSEVKDGATEPCLPSASKGSNDRGICVNMLKKSAKDESSMKRKIVSNYESFHDLPAGSATLEQAAASSAGLSGWAAFLPRSDDSELESKRLRIS